MTGRTHRPSARPVDRMARRPGRHSLRQWTGVHPRDGATVGEGARHSPRFYPAGTAATERVHRTLQSDRALRLARANPVRFHRTGPGRSDSLALDVQQRTVQYGLGWHHAGHEAGSCRTAPLLAPATNGGITQALPGLLRRIRTPLLSPTNSGTQSKTVIVEGGLDSDQFALSPRHS